MNARAAAILIVLLAVLGGGTYIYQKQEASPPAGAAALGQRILPGLKAADVAAIRITQPGATLTLQRADAGWTLAERGGFPADVAKVRQFVLQAIELKVGESEPIGDKDRARLRLDPPGKQAGAGGTLIEFMGADGKPLARLVAGNKYFRRETDHPDQAPGDGRFVQRPEQPGTLYIVSDPLAQASTKSADWIDRTAFKVEKVKSLALRFPDGSGWRIERSGDNADWKLDGARAGEKLDVPKANAASYSLSLLELADVASPDAQNTGLDKPIVIDATTLAGVSYAIKVGRLEGENYYVSFASAGAEAREKMLASHVLLIPKGKLEDTLKPRADLLEKKQDAKK